MECAGDRVAFVKLTSQAGIHGQDHGSGRGQPVGAGSVVNAAGDALEASHDLEHYHSRL